MEHVVFYQSTQGTPAFRRVSSLDDAVSFAEHLRNVEGVTDFSLYSLTPVTLSLRAYYHVEVTGDGARQTAEAPPTRDASQPTAPAPDDAPAAKPGSKQPDYVAGTPFTAAPLVPTASTPESSRGDGPVEGEPLPGAAVEAAVIDPSVVDPTVEEVVPSGRRSMGFFARP